ncbi:MAG: hypothetical protein KBA71_09455 [Opitutaceae bacterium]|nr:hypothetical protein [Opitutaceae bacterium]
MTTSQRPLFYLILGTPGSERRSVLVDLIADGLDEGDLALTFLHEAEAASEFDRALGELRTWHWEAKGVAAEMPDSISDASDTGADKPRFSHVFFVAEGSGNPVDQVEAIKAWIAPFDVEFARVITFINCTLASRHRELGPWWDACVHFSDVVLLSHRVGVPNKWISDFQEHFRSKFIPALFEFVKEGRVKNPALVLEPQARRMSQVFDQNDGDWILARKLAPDAEIEFGTDDDEGSDGAEGEDVDGASAVEPYFERRANGSRVIELPDIRKFLGNP